MTKVLRQTDNPQFTNLNDTISSAQHDNNFIEFQAEINEGRGLNSVTPYDNAKIYRLNEFVSEDFNIYRYISDVAASGIVPGTDETKWVLSSLAEFLLDHPIIIVTPAELDALRIANQLKPGREYQIVQLITTERGYSILSRASSTSTMSTTATMLSLLADYQDIGDYTGVAGFAGQLGVFTDTKGALNYDNLAGGPFTVGETVTGGTSGATGEVVDDSDPTLTLRNIVGEFENDEVLTGGTSAATADADGNVTYTFNPGTGNVVIWEGRNYRKKTDDPTSADPDTDGTNYEVLDYLITNGYVLENHDIGIDLNTDLTGAPVEDQYDTFIFRRRDDRSNDVYSPLLFQWGNDEVKDNNVSQGSVLDCLNNLQTIESNQVISSTITANMQTNDLRNNTFNRRTEDVSLATEDFEDDGQIFFASLLILSADILQLNTVPQQIVPSPGPGKMIEVVTESTKIVNSGAVTAYTANTSTTLITDTADDHQSQDSGILISTTSRRTRGLIFGSGPGTVDQQLLEDKALMVSSLTGNPATGTFDIKKFVSYRIINS